MQAQRRSRLRLFAVILPLIVSLLIGSLGLFLTHVFEKNLPQELFEADGRATPPSFYAYSFTDRADRIGEAYPLEVGGFAASSADYTPIEAIPEHLVNAFIAIEDKRFYRHHGVDWYRTLAAGVAYVFGFSDSFGASTITQQTVKNVTGENQVTLRRKLQEILYARDLERLCTKEEILELYLNVIPFSDGCIGVGAAADHYFSKTPKELTPAESACIAAITNNPSYYNPIRHPENNRRRRDLILSQMREQGYLGEEEYLEQVASQTELRENSRGSGEEIRSWYADMVIEDVIRDLGERYGMSRAAASLRLHTGGLRIEVAMDPEIQSAVEDYYRSQMRTPKGANGDRAQSAMIVLDSKTGDILGVAGAIGEKRANRIQNYATQTLRSPGSVIKPLSVYGPALEKGIINWASVYDDVPVRFTGEGRHPWPRNAVGTYRGLTTVAHAVAHSTNTVAVRVLESMGAEESFRFAKERFHLENLIGDGDRNDRGEAALALGQLQRGLTLRELTAAYSVFADRGCYHPCRSYYRVLTAGGEILLSNADASEIVMSAENAAIMTKLLEGVIKGGTASELNLKGDVACAGKTGTTMDDHDRWFIGYTTELICGVWCGFDHPEPVADSGICKQAFQNVMNMIPGGRVGAAAFDLPSGVFPLSYCKDSGMLPGVACSHDPRGARLAMGWFTAENRPSASCDCHVLCEVDAIHGGISHGHCPITKKAALLRVKRALPFAVEVADAQLVFGGDPHLLPPQADPSLPYFGAEVGISIGESTVAEPFNRSCPFHGGAPEETGEEPPSEENKPPPARIW